MLTILASIMTYIIYINTEIVIVIDNIVTIRNSEYGTREIVISEIINKVIFLSSNFEFSINIFIINYTNIINFSIVISNQT